MRRAPWLLLLALLFLAPWRLGASFIPAGGTAFGQPQGRVGIADAGSPSFAWLAGAGRLSAWGATPGLAAQPVVAADATAATLPAALVEAAAWRGRRVDATGRVWLGARWYAPADGRFLSPDPLGHAASWDLYSFAGGDPWNHFDPDGRDYKYTFSDSVAIGLEGALQKALVDPLEQRLIFLAEYARQSYGLADRTAMGLLMLGARGADLLSMRDYYANPLTIGLRQLGYGAQAPHEVVQFTDLLDKPRATVAGGYLDKGALQGTGETLASVGSIGFWNIGWGLYYSGTGNYQKSQDQMLAAGLTVLGLRTTPFFRSKPAPTLPPIPRAAAQNAPEMIEQVAQQQQALSPLRSVDISKLTPPSSRPFADPLKLMRQGPFDWNKYTPIIVEQNGSTMTIMDGMTRVQNAQNAGITNLPAYVYPAH